MDRIVEFLGNIRDFLFDFSSFRSIIVTLSTWTIAIVAILLLWRVLLGRRGVRPSRSEPGLEVELAEADPQNLSPFLADDDLEGRRLERVLFGAFVMSVLIALSLFLYFMREPVRTNASIEKFNDESVERGAVLYANDQMPEFNSTQSLACANCHGTKGEGGVASFVITPVAEGEAPVRVAWKAPPLNTVILRYPADAAKIEANTPLDTQLAQILTYGRPGTPMPAWGVAGGGAKNEQSIGDLVNYLYTIQIGNGDAMLLARDQVSAAESQPAENLQTRQEELKTAQDELAAAQQEGVAATIAAAQEKLDAAVQAVADAQRWVAERENVTDGQLLFEANCARCHTKGWSYFDPNDPYALPDWTGPIRDAAGDLVQGSGAFGPELQDGRSLTQFPEQETQIEFVTNGSLFQKPYGVNGIGSGRMPGFINVLTEEQIDAIVEYERQL